MPTRYYIRLPDPSNARGADPALGFHSQGADGFAEELQHALRENTLFCAWRDKQEDPDSIDPSLGTADPAAVVIGKQRDLHIDLEVVTALPSDLLRHRMTLLAGNHWQLRDVTAV